MQFASASQSITVSLGVSVVLPDWPGERNDIFLQKIIARADTALYRAKDTGRNRVCTASVTPPDPALEDTE